MSLSYHAGRSPEVALIPHPWLTVGSRAIFEIKKVKTYCACVLGPIELYAAGIEYRCRFSRHSLIIIIVSSYNTKINNCDIANSGPIYSNYYKLR